MDDLMPKVVCVLDEALTALDVQRNFLQLAAEECDHAGGREDQCRRMAYAQRVDLMITLIYAVDDKARELHEQIQTALSECMSKSKALQS